MTHAVSRLAAWDLAVACARHAAGIDAADGVVRAAHSVLEWPEAIDLVREQGLLSWLTRSVEREQMPAPAGALLRALSSEDAARTLAQAQRLGVLSDAFGRAGIPMIPYKGPLLSLQLYGDVALRRSTDLDLVVPRASYERAREVLASRGLPSRGGHSLRQERALFAWLGHAPFGRDDDFIELHWRFAPTSFPFALEPEHAIARATRVTVAGSSLLAMHPDDLLVTLSMHGVRHLYERLEWLAGVARLVREANVSAVLAHAAQLRAKRMLLTSVGVVARVLGMPLSGPWTESLAQDPEAAQLAHLVAEGAVMQGVNRTPLLDGFALQSFYGRLMDSPHERRRLLVRAALLPTEREWELITLPDALTPLYRVVRPLRILAKYATRILRG